MVSKFHYTDMLPTCCGRPCRHQVGNKLAASQSTGKLRGNVCNGFWT